MKTNLWIVLFFGSILHFSYAQNAKEDRLTSEGKLKINKQYGFFDFSYEPETGKVFLYVDRSNHLEKEFLYINRLSSGIGSNDIGLDRGQLGSERLVYFKKMGNKLMLIQPNLDYRSSSENLLEQKSIEQAFAKSVLYGFPIQKTTSSHM